MLVDIIIQYILSNDSCSLRTWTHCWQSPSLAQWNVTSLHRHWCGLVLVT